MSQIATLPRVLAVAPRAAEAASSPLAFRALLAFTAVLVLAPQNVFPVLEPLHLAQLTAGVAILAHVVAALAHRRPILLLTRETWVAAALAGWAVLSLPASYWPSGSAAFLLDVFFKSLVVFWLLAANVNTPRRLAQAGWLLCLLGVPIAISGVRHFGAGMFLGGEGAAGVKRILGYDAPLTGNPNDLALMLNLILPIGVALFLAERRRLVRLGLAAVIALQVTGVIVTFSRGGFLTLATIGAIYLGRALRGPARVWATAFVVFLLLASSQILPEGYVGQMSTIVDIGSDPTGSASERLADMLDATSFVVQNPILGVGAGMNVLALNEERGALWRMVHSAYLQYAVELGIPGLLLFVLLLIRCIRSAARSRRQATQDGAPPAVRRLAEGIEISLLAFAIAALFHPIGYHFYFYYFAGLAVALPSVCTAAVPLPRLAGGGR